MAVAQLSPTIWAVTLLVTVETARKTAIILINYGFRNCLYSSMIFDGHGLTTAIKGTLKDEGSHRIQSKRPRNSTIFHTEDLPLFFSR